MKTALRFTWSIIPLALLVAADARAQSPLDSLKGQSVAVSCFALSDRAKPAVRSLQARLEEILGENGVKVLDETKAAEMRQGYHLLSDPTVVVTAELLVELREKFKVDRLLNFYCDCDIVPGIAEFFTATARGDLRLIDTTARVEARVSRPMGVVGNPGSDAVTEGAARLNALERTMDDVASGLGLKISTPAEPRLIRLTLEPVASAPGVDFVPAPATGKPELGDMVSLEKQTWQKESVTLTALSPDGNYGAVATYIWSQRMQSGRTWGSRLHVVDAKTRRQVTTYDFSPLASTATYEKYGKEVLAATFLGSWRFLLAVNANEVVFWDVERGRELSRIRHTGGSGGAQIAVGKGGFVRVHVGRADLTYRLAITQ